MLPSDSEKPEESSDRFGIESTFAFIGPRGVIRVPRGESNDSILLFRETEPVLGPSSSPDLSGVSSKISGLLQMSSIPLRRFVFRMSLLGLFASQVTRLVQADETADAHRVMQIFEQKCDKCHSASNEQLTGMRILERETLLQQESKSTRRWLVPGEPDHSKIYLAIKSGYMPEGSPDLSPQEIELVRAWIVNGAEFPSVSARPYLSEADVLAQILSHLNQAKQSDIPYLRYFSLAHLHNNPTVREPELQQTRAALAKALNCMSREPFIELPKAIDPSMNAVFWIDLRWYGWGEDKIQLWSKVLDEYPYGVEPTRGHAADHSEKIADRYGRLYPGVPYLRIDWFVREATRPPLYHELADIPQTLAELDQRESVDRDTDFNLETVSRGAVHQSGVSQHNRVLDRHSSRNGMYWISYDFSTSGGRGNLARYPLGPKHDNNRFGDDFGFEHAGNEIIFRRPNGLHGYMLTDAVGKRISSGPIEIVHDGSKSAGTVEVVNGISCMSCHNDGMKGFTDVIRESHGIPNRPAITRLESIYLPHAKMKQVLDRDRRNYRDTLYQVMKPFMPNLQPNVAMPDPIRIVAQRYDRDLDLTDVTYELGFDDPEVMKVKLGAQALLELGLGPLQDGFTIKRSMWSDPGQAGGVSCFHHAAAELSQWKPLGN